MPLHPEEPILCYSWFLPEKKEIATHSSILAWEIPRTEELGRLQSMGSGLHSRLPRGVRPRLEGKPRTPLSSRVATRVSWSPLSGLEGVQPPLPFGVRTRDCSPGHKNRHNRSKGKARAELRPARRHSQTCQTVCDLMDCSLPGSSVHGILQARILEWVAMPSSRGSSPPSD